MWMYSPTKNMHSCKYFLSHKASQRLCSPTFAFASLRRWHDVMATYPGLTSSTDYDKEIPLHLHLYRLSQKEKLGKPFQSCVVELKMTSKPGVPRVPQGSGTKQGSLSYLGCQVILELHGWYGWFQGYFLTAPMERKRSHQWLSVFGFMWQPFPCCEDHINTDRGKLTQKSRKMCGH